MPAQQVLQRKISEVEEITELVKRYRVIGIASLQKVRAAQLQGFKKNLADRVHMKVTKNTLMKMAIEKCEEKPELKRLFEYLNAANIFLFADINPLKLALLLAKGKVRVAAKSGDTAAIDVIVSSGNTGQPPGPIISQLNAVGLPTRIESGSVWISKDTLVTRRGEVISERLAIVLSKLGMKPVEAGLTMKVAYENGLVITEDQLHIDIDKTRQNFEDAHTNALMFSIRIVYPTSQNMKMLLQIACKEAYTLAVNRAIPTKETIARLIRNAHTQMLSLSSRLSSLTGTEKPAKKTEKLK